MILTISTTHNPATDLGFLLHKNPNKVHSAELSFGKAHVFYPEASEDRCTAALLLEIDPITLVRGRVGSSSEGLFEQYVNDRPYVASSFLSTAMTEFFSTAMGGRSKNRQELADSEIPIEVHVPVLPCRGGESFLRALFEPLGYEVEAEAIPLQEKFPEWGGSRYLSVTLRRTGRLKDTLAHLYVLIPVLDDEKHYFVGKEEIDKLLRRGEQWVKGHPEKNEIVRRYLQRQKTLTREALARLADDDPDPDEAQQEHSFQETAIEEKISLHQLRLNAVRDVLRESGARRVIDLGSGEGKLVSLLLKEKQFTEIAAMDVALSVLERAERNLRYDRMPPKQKEKLKLLHGSLVYRDKRIAGYDAAAVIEVIEHLDPSRLRAFERAVFEFAKPGTVAITTPNAEYNVMFETLPAGTMRHRDHRFEWTRAEFQAWAQQVAESHGYEVTFAGIGPEDEALGSPSQMAVFRR